MDKSRSCKECGREVSEQARFCEHCGAAVVPGAQPLRAPDALAERIITQRSAIEGERKQVTVMFTDIVRSMDLTRTLEAERWGLLLDRFLTISCRAIHDLEGTVNQFTGDGLMAVFGAPVAHEDHARRACLAALRLQRDLKPFAAEVAREHGIDFRVRCGLNSGEVVVGEIGDDLHMDFAPIGNTSGMGKRMEALAPVGSTAISASTAALVEEEFRLEELGEFDIKGATGPHRVFQLVGLGAAHSRLEAAAARGLSRFVGRDQERRQLDAALERALAGEGTVVAVAGDPGVGKSRLCREFASACRTLGVRVDSGAAVAHGRHVPMLAVLGMLRDFFGISDDEAPGSARAKVEAVLLGFDFGFEPELPLIFDFLGVPDPEHPAERADPDARQRRLLAFVRRLVQARSRHEPAVIVVEDLHWIDEASAVFLDELIQAVDGTRTLLVVTFRPEYEAEWISRVDVTRIALGPLEPDASRALLEGLLGQNPSLDGLADVIDERTAGNPFFIEEVVRTLAETGHLAGERGDYTLVAPLEELVLPPTVQAVLAARIDRLRGREKALLQKMSVIGKDAPAALLMKVGNLDRAQFEESVTALQAAEFITESGSNGDREFAFKHPLTQEVAYTSQLSAARARAHAAVGEAIECLYSHGLDERAALLAHHAEGANQTLKASQWHARAAAWVSVSAPAEGLRHWRRVRELSDSLADSREADGLALAARVGILALAWRVGLPDEEIAAIHTEGQQRLGVGTERPQSNSSGDGVEEETLQQIRLDLAQAGIGLLTGREREGMEVLAATRKATAEIADPGLQLTVSAFSGFVAFWVSGVSLRDVLEGADRALAIAGDDFLAGSGFMLGNAYANCLWVRAACRGFLGDLPAALRDYDQALEIAREHTDEECEQFAYDSRSGLLAQVGDSAGALADAARALKLADASGAPNRIAGAQAFIASAKLASGDAVGARAAAETALSTVRENALGLNFEAWLLAILANARLQLDQTEPALAAAKESRAIARERSLRVIPSELAFARASMRARLDEGSDDAAAALTAALDEAMAGGFRIYEPEIRTELAAHARLRGDEGAAERAEAEAAQVMAQIMPVREESGASPDRDSGDATARILLDVAYAATLFLGGREVEGLKLHRRAWARAEATGNPALIVTLAATTSYSEATVGPLRNAIDRIDRALALAGDDVTAGAGILLGCPYAHCLWIRAVAKSELGQLAAAQQDFERAIQLAGDQADGECEAYARLARAWEYAYLLDLKQAADDLEASLRLAERVGNNVGLVKARAARAVVRLEAGEFAAARDDARTALALSREYGVSMDWLPEILGAVARSQLELGEVDEARQAAEEAVRVADERSLRRGAVWAHLTLAGVLIRTANGDDWATAELELGRAAEAAEERGYRSAEPRIHRERALLARLRGDEQTAARESVEEERILVEMGIAGATRTWLQPPRSEAAPAAAAARRHERTR